jgi:nucleotide-binding universal stress UspA family protein
MVSAFASAGLGFPEMFCEAPIVCGLNTSGPEWLVNTLQSMSDGAESTRLSDGRDIDLEATKIELKRAIEVAHAQAYGPYQVCAWAHAGSNPQPILISYDGSAEARSALNRAGEFALTCGREIYVLAVVDTASAVASSLGMAGSTAYVEIASATAILLDEAVLCLKARGTTVHGHVSLGRVVDCIAEHAAIVDADVIVLGYRQRSRLARWWDSGPTMDELLVRAGRTVMTVPCC